MKKKKLKKKIKELERRVISNSIDIKELKEKTAKTVTWKRWEPLPVQYPLKEEKGGVATLGRYLARRCSY